MPWHRARLAEVLADRGRLPHALLICGPRGIGKVAFGRALAAGLLCENPAADHTACGTCASCNWFQLGNHPDFRELTPESAQEDDSEEPVGDGKAKKKSQVIKIAEIRAVQDYVTLTSHRGGLKISLIHPAEAMQPAAANALLKTLEEPPANTLLVLVSHQPARVLATVRSRARKLPLAPPSHAEATDWLSQRGVADAAALAALTSGAPLLAEELAASESAQVRVRLVEGLAQGSAIDAVGLAPQLEKGTVDGALYLLQTWVADLILQREAAAVRFHPARHRELAALAVGTNLPQLFRYWQALGEMRRLAAHPLNARLLYESLLISYAQCFTASRS